MHASPIRANLSCNPTTFVWTTKRNTSADNPVLASSVTIRTTILGHSFFRDPGWPPSILVGPLRMQLGPGRGPDDKFVGILLYGSRSRHALSCDGTPAKKKVTRDVDPIPPDLRHGRQAMILRASVVSPLTDFFEPGMQSLRSTGRCGLSVRHGPASRPTVHRLRHTGRQGSSRRGPHFRQAVEQVSLGL